MSNKATFNLLGEIVQDDSQRWFESDIVPAMLIGWLKNQNGADVEININSPGGDVAAGLAIANAIKAYEGHTTANVLGVAASMASVIACACDEVKMGEGAFLMIHNPWTVTMGDADDLRKDAETLDKMRDSVIAFYQSKTSASADDLKALMDADSWLAKADLEANGFTVGDYADDFRAAACVTRRHFDAVPEAARRFLAEMPGDWNKRFSGLQAAKDKEIASLRAQVAANETALSEAKAAHDAQMDELRSSHETLQADIDAKQTALAEAQAKVEQLSAKCAEAEKALAQTQAALAAETKRYREQVGLALQQPAEELPTLESGLAKCATPAEKSAFIASGKYRK